MHDDARTSLEKLYQFVNAECARAITWYFQKKRNKRIFGSLFRVGAILALAVSGIIPVLGEIYEVDDVPRISPAWATIALACAALLISLDRYGGYTSGWIRYMRTGLLKFARDRRRYLQWVFEAKKRYSLSVLGYAVTSNHVHLLVRDNGHRDVIPKSIQLIAGRTGQAFNKRKNRKGAYWEGRYHGTAIGANKHLIQCLVYIDLYPVKYGWCRSC